MITASLTTVAYRRPALEQMLPTILPQVDRLNVFLEGYDTIPDFLRDPRITVVAGRDHPQWLELRSNSKLFWIAQGLVDEGIHITVDDDILYPSDYVSQCASKIERYQRKAIVGFHGSVFKSDMGDIFRDRQLWHFDQACPTDVGVHMIGTGTTAWHTSTLRLMPDDVHDWDAVDFRVAIAAQRQRVPMVCLARDAGYLRALPLASDPRSCSELTSYKERMAGFYREHSPWTVHPAVSVSPRRPVVVVVPCFNEQPARVMRSVESALATPGVDVVRVVDDGSPDPLVLPQREQLEVIRCAVNGGPAAALSAGIRTLPSDAIVCRLDVGDVFYPETKARQIAEVVSGVCRASGSPRFDPVAGVERRPAPDWQQRIYTDAQFAAPTTVYERSVWADVGGNADMRWCEDWLFAIKVQAYVGWRMFPDVTCSAGEFPGGHSDVSADKNRRSERAKCRARAADIGRALGNPDRVAHLFNETWCKKHGTEPLRMPVKK